MIFLQKYYRGKKLEAWNYSFRGVDELIRFMKKNRLFILGDGYKLEIKQNSDIKIKSLFKKEGK